MKFTDAWLDEGQKRQVTRRRASGVPFVHAGDSHPCSVPDGIISHTLGDCARAQDHAAAPDASHRSTDRMRTKHAVN
jgi:hypothetical protein